MDRGAARSRKRAAKLEKSASMPTRAPGGAASDGHSGFHQSNGQGWKRDANATAGPSRPRAPLPSQEDSRPRKGAALTGPRLKKEKKVPSDDPNQFKPKAIRNSTALIYSSSAFPIPPSREQMKGVTRVDLAGSGCQDVGWLEGTVVTWLSLKGCPVTAGWEAVGKLKDLAVLNISECDLKTLPKSLKGLGKLKAVVAMNNPWSALDEEVISSWPDLNSLIVSHSPNLKFLPSGLGDLPHLSKLTFSHCPRITASSLPDLSSLPLLRDVKMNNLPQLTSLPPHLATWGTGDLSRVKLDSTDGEKPRKGEGLEVLDLGNCSLDWPTIASTFGLDRSNAAGNSSKKTTKAKAGWGHLRSLTLHSNPFTTTQPDYAEQLQGATSLPKLQIIDSKRVVQRVHAGQVPETKAERRKKERRERKYGKSDAGYAKRPPTQAAEAGEGKIGDKKGEAGKPVLAERKPKVEKRAADHRAGESNTEKKRKRDTETDDSFFEKRPKANWNEAKSTKKSVVQTDSAHPKPTVDEPVSTANASDPSLAQASNPKRGPKSESAVLSVIDIPRDQAASKSSKAGKEKEKGKDKSSKPKGKDGQVEEVQGGARGGVDLRQMLSAPKAAGDEGTGLGVGGW